MSRKEHQRRPAPSRTLEGRENQMISLATNLAEKQIIEGTASSQVITHYLKLGTTRERLEQTRLENEVALLETKRESIESAKRTEELFADALRAMKSYQGGDEELEPYEE